MKRLFLFFSFFVAVLCYAQDSTVKIYAYKQAVSPGIRPMEPISEQGKNIAVPPKAHINYIIYLSHPSDVRVYPLELWINGQQWGVKQEAVTQTPVEVLNNYGPNVQSKTTLVPHTNETVWLLLPTEDTWGKKAITKPALIKENELVVVYRMHGKVYTQPIKKMTALKTAVMQ